MHDEEYNKKLNEVKSRMQELYKKVRNKVKRMEEAE